MISEDSKVASGAETVAARRYRLLFVDDHPLYREGLQRALTEALPEVEILVAATASAAIGLLRADADIDLCLVDYRLDDADGLSLLARIGSDFPSVARGLMSAALTPELVRRAREIGCIACLSKARDASLLGEALKTLFDGGTVFDGGSVPDAASVLTEKRLDVLRYAAAGDTNKEIARRLGCAERSVKDHWTHIFERLGVTTRAEAVGEAYRRQLL